MQACCQHEKCNLVRSSLKCLRCMHVCISRGVRPVPCVCWADGTIRLMSDVLRPTAAASAHCPALHVPAHPSSLHVDVCVFHPGDRWPIACEVRRKKITPLNWFEKAPAFVCSCVYLSLKGDKLQTKCGMRGRMEASLVYCTSYTLYHSDSAEGSWIINEVQANRLPAVQPP